MKIDLKYIIKPWYFAWLFLILLIITVFNFYLYRRDAKARFIVLVERQKYMQEERELDKILSENERYLKVTTMYGEIRAAFGQKYHKKWNIKTGYTTKIVKGIKKKKVKETLEQYNKSGRWANQGLSKEQEADINRKCYEYSRLLNIPYFDVYPTALVESDFNPLARTFWPDGSICEAGMWQNRWSAVKQAVFFLSKMTKRKAKIMDFRYNSIQDLFDPINALKIECVLYWGARWIFDNDPSWYVPAIHWGIDRMIRYWKYGIMPPDKFVFNEGTVKEAARNPFKYYFFWNAYQSQFRKFTTKVYIEKGWRELYLKGCSKIEFEYVEDQKIIRDLVAIKTGLDKAAVKYEVKYSYLVKKYHKKIAKLDSRYKVLNRMIKEGRYKKINDIFIQGIAEFKQLRKEIISKEITLKRKVVILTILLIELFLIIFALIGIILSIVLIIRRVKIIRRRKEDE